MHFGERLIIQPVQHIVGRIVPGKATGAGVGGPFKVHGAGVTVNRWNVAGEQPQLVLPEGTSDRIPGLDGGVLVFFLDVIVRTLIVNRPETQLGICGGTGVIAKAAGELLSGGYVGWARLRCRRALIIGVQLVAPIKGHQAPVPFVAAALLDDVYDAAQRAAVLGLGSSGLDLNFLNELEDNVLLDSALLDVAGVHSLDEVGVFAVAGSVNLESVLAQAVGAGALQGLLTSTGGEPDHRLIGPPMGKCINVLSCNRHGHVAGGDVRGLSRNLNRFGHSADVESDFVSGKLTG